MKLKNTIGTVLLASMVLSQVHVPVKVQAKEDLFLSLKNSLMKDERETCSEKDALYITDSDKSLESLIDSLLAEQGTSHETKNYEYVSIDNLDSIEERSVNSDFKVLEVAEDSQQKTITYEEDGVRYIIDYNSDGTYMKTMVKFRQDGSFEYFENFNNEKYTEKDSLDMMVSDVEEDQDDREVCASAKRVDPYPITKYKKSAVFQTSELSYFSALNTLGYTAWQPVNVYRSVLDFDEITADSILIKAKENINLAATWWDIAKTTAKSFYAIADVAVATSGAIDQATKPIKEHEYDFMGGMEVTVYDPITYKANVEVIGDWYPGTYSLGYDLVYNGFANAQWKITAIPDCFEKSNSKYIKEAITLYNDEIKYYKKWTQGKGTLGY